MNKYSCGVPERDLLESDLRHSDIYMKFHSTNEADQIIGEEDWNTLREELDKTYNNFTNRLYQLYSGMSLIETPDLLLDKDISQGN